jgi:hypothetical protein
VGNELIPMAPISPSTTTTVESQLLNSENNNDVSGQKIFVPTKFEPGTSGVNISTSAPSNVWTRRENRNSSGLQSTLKVDFFTKRYFRAIPASCKFFFWSLPQGLVWVTTAICVVTTGIDLFLQSLEKQLPTSSYLQTILVGSYALMVNCGFNTLQICVLPQLLLPA